MSELNILELISPIVFPVLLGWIVVQTGLMAATDARVLTTAFLYLFMPALLIEHLSTQNLTQLLDGRFIVATFCLMIGLYAGLFLVHRILLRRPLDMSAVAALTGTKFNTVIIGLPLLLATLGRQAIVPLIINLISGYFTILPLTLIVLELSKSRHSLSSSTTLNAILRALRQTIRDPLIVSTIVGLLIAGVGITLPEWFDQTLLSLGNAAFSVPLVAVGMTIGAKVFSQHVAEVLWMSAVRMILSPLLAIAAAKLFNLPPVLAVALIVSFSLPTAKLVFAVAEEYDTYVNQSAAIITLTTISLIVAYPITLWVCEHLWPGIIGVKA